MSASKNSLRLRLIKAGVGLFVALACLIGIAAILIPHEAERLRANPEVGRLEGEPAVAVSKDTDEEIAGVDWAYWKEVNPDIVGWITIPNTPIDYPIVQASAMSPTYYLNHDVYGKYNNYGCPYVDAGCSITSPNTIIYAHNMGGIDTSMFSALPNYLDLKYLGKHAQVIIQTPDKVLELEVRCAENVSPYGYDKGQSFSSVDELQDYYQSIWDRADTRTKDAQAEKINQLFSLITCDKGGATRTVVYAG